MADSRSDAASILRRVGRRDLAETIEKELPENADMQEVIEFAARFGITREWLVNRMGGSP